MRLATFVCLFLLSACASSGGDAPPPARIGPVAGVPDSLAARLVPTALAASFERLAGTTYRARVVVVQTDDVGRRLGRFERAFTHTPSGLRSVTTRAQGTLADTAGLDLPRLADPFPHVLADTPAYLAPSTRDQYTARAGAARGTVRAVDVQHTADTDQAVERVTAAVDTATGDVLRFAVFRTSTSAIYDEATRAEVRLARAPGGPLPRAVETTSTVSTPLAGTTTYRVSWTIGPVANTR